MIKKIHIEQYRKLSNMDLGFREGINVISGTNGTCKTSLLHMVSNAYQAVTVKCAWLRDPACLNIIKQINQITNPKIESLTKGDKSHNDPGNGLKGTLFSVDYYGHAPLDFRKHNSKLHNRYAVKPYYRPGTTETLPFCPVIYLGLARLYPFGEYPNEAAIERIKKNLPDSYLDKITSIYRKLTGMSVSAVSPQRMGDIKTRADFESDKSGIDSNTISAGEDNLFIIISALVSLQYYYDNIISNNGIESVLLIDEFDATLHPSLQFKLLEIFREYSASYKIQIIFTTHSLSTVEYALNRKDNVIYLYDNITSVVKIESPDIYTIKMYLYDKTRDDIFLSKSIPVFSEDEEARVFLRILFDYFEEKYPVFSSARNLFHFVDANIGANNLKSIFSDSFLIKTTMRCICILDGDQSRDLDKYTAALPGSASPEKVIMNYAIQLYSNDSSFWTDDVILSLNYGKIHFRDNIKPDIDEISARIQELRDSGKSTKGVERDLRKKVFNKHSRFFEMLFKFWVHDTKNADSIYHFYRDLNALFKKVAEFHGISSRIWNI